MNCPNYYSHKGAEEEVRGRNGSWLFSLYNTKDLNVEPRGGALIREYTRQQLVLQGWSGEITINNEYDLTVFSKKADLAFQVQTGNASRAPYDLLKLQYLYAEQQIAAAILALPTRVAAKILGDNIASFERVAGELALFDRIITVPILLLAFE
jgi:hypothetical protein